MVLRLVLGTIYLVMAVGQLASWSDLPQIFGAYDVTPDAGVRVLASGLIAGELICGIWFLGWPRSHALTPAWMYTMVSLTWATLGTQAYFRGLSIPNCGCFGRYLSQELSWFVLAQDVLLLAYAVVLFVTARAATKRKHDMAPITP